MNIFQRAALRLAGVTIKDLQALHPEAFTRELLYSGNADQAKDSTPQTSNAYDEYAGQAWVYKATSTVARSFRAVPLYVMRGEDWLEGHPIERLLAKPNPAMTGSGLWERWITDVYLAGETGLEVTRNKRGEVAELWPRQGQTVTIDAASSRYLKANGYTIKDGAGDPYRLGVDEFIWSWLYNPLSAWRGLGVYQAAALGINTDKQAQRYAAKFFKKQARPDWVGLSPQGSTQTEKAMMYAQIEAMTEGRNSGIILEQGVLDIKPLSFAPKDVIWEVIRAMTREEIGAVAGVPGELMGDKSATYENRSEAVKSFWNDTIRPLASWRDEYLTEYFRNIGAIRPDEAIESDFSGIEALEQSYNDRLTYAQGLIGLGVTLRDANEMFDLGIPDASLDASEIEPEPEPAAPQGQPAPNVAPAEGQDTPQKRYKYEGQPRDEQGRFGEGGGGGTDNGGPGQVTPKQDAALRSYLGRGYIAINDGLRYGYEMTDEERATVRELDNVIANNSESFSGLSRGVEVDPKYRAGHGADLAAMGHVQRYEKEKELAYEYIKSKYPVGEVITDKGYSSTSKSIDVAFDHSGPTHNSYNGGDTVPGVVFQISHAVGLDVAKVVPQHDYQDEYEVIIARDSRFRVTGISNGYVSMSDSTGQDERERIVVQLEHLAPKKAKSQKALTRAMLWPAYGSDEHKAMLDVWEKALAPREARMRQALRQLFSEQEKDVLRRLNAGKSYGAPVVSGPDEIVIPHIVDKAKVKSAADNPFDLAKWIRLFRVKLSPHIRLTLAEAGRDAMNDLNIGVSFDVSEPQVLNYMRDRENKIKGVVEKTFDDLKRDISEGIDAGESIDKLAARVQERMGPIADGRATMIARTEVIGASNGGKVLAWKQSGVVTGKRWLASTSHMGADDPHPVRETHVDAHGQEVAIDKDFEVGNGAGPAPGQIGEPEEDINCRCTMLAVTDQGRGMKALPAPEPVVAETRQPINVTVSVAAPVVNVTNQTPAQPAPVVNVAAAEVNIPEQAAPVVNVSVPEAKAQPAPVVNVSLPRATSQTQTVNRDDKGNIVSTTTRIVYEGQ